MDMRLDVDEDVNRNGALDPGEDVNRNGILDAGEDTNHNGRLDLSKDVDGDGRLDDAEDLNGEGVLQVGADPELGRSAYGPLLGGGNGATKITVQGRGCMTTGADSHILISVFNAQYDFTTKSGGVRGFIPDAALPARGLATGTTHRRGERISLSGMTTSVVAHLFDAKCDTDACFPGPQGTPRRHGSPTSWRTRQFLPARRPLPGRQLVGVLRRQLPRLLQRVPEPHRRSVGSEDCQDLCCPCVVEPSRVKQMPIMINTSGVGGGGIVRAIVPVASTYKEYDHFRLRGPYEFCAKRLDATATRRALKHTAWKYIKVTGTPIRGLGAEEPDLEHLESDAIRCNTIAANP